VDYHDDFGCSLFHDTLIRDHVVSDIIQDFEIRINQFVIKLNLFLCQFVVVCIDFIYELTVEVNHSFEFLSNQTSHALINLVILLLNFLLWVFIGNLKLLNWLYSYPEIAVD
jgi:hypothetical protein